MTSGASLSIIPAARGGMIKSAAHMEKLFEVDTIVFAKTGALAREQDRADRHNAAVRP